MKNKQQALQVLNLVRQIDRNDALGFNAAQGLLADLGILALPKPGHGCPECNRAGAIYCFDTAVRNVRNMPDDYTEGGLIN